MTTLAQNPLLRLRETTKISQRAAAKNLGVSLRQYQRWEAQQLPVPRVLMRLLVANGMAPVNEQSALFQALKDNNVRVNKQRSNGTAGS